MTFIALLSNEGAVATPQTDYRSKGVCHADAFFSPLFYLMSCSTSFDYKLFANLTNDNVVFVTRLKDNAVHTNMGKGARAVDADGKWGDYQIQFTVKNALATGCVEYRVVQWYDEDSQRWFEFLTNDRELEPEEIVQLYRDRWQIELFFKKDKQNLKIKDFFGTSYNAVMSQVWCAAIAILLLEVLRLQSEYPWSFSNLVHILRLHLLCFRLIQDWLNTPDKAATPVSSPVQLIEMYES